jgi:hypothetical protein
MELTECSETSAHKNSVAGESPKRKNTAFRTRWKFEIKNLQICENRDVFLQRWKDNNRSATNSTDIMRVGLGYELTNSYDMAGKFIFGLTSFMEL